MPKNVKFSWKDVKKQQQLQQKQQHQSLTTDKSPDNSEKDHICTSPKSSCPWGQVKQETSVTSLRDVMSEDRKKKDVVIPFEKTSSQEPKGKSQIVSWGLPTSRVKGAKKGPSTGASTTDVQSPPASRSHENPWKVITPVKSPVDSSVSFSDIVEDELQKYETFTRTTTKPLHLIQIEERAIQELLQHYKAGENNDEVITVERVAQDMAAPVWAAKQQTKQTVRDG